MKKMLFLMLFLLILGAANVNSQVRIGGNGQPNTAAVLDLNATDGTNNGTKTLALPRVSLSSTTDKLSNATLLTGMLVYNTNNSVGEGVYYWDGSQWIKPGGTYSGSTSITLSGTSFQRAELTGDVTAPANSNVTTIADGAVTAAKLADMSASDGMILMRRNNVWTPVAPSALFLSWYRDTTLAVPLAPGGFLQTTADWVRFPPGCQRQNTWVKRIWPQRYTGQLTNSSEMLWTNSSNYSDTDLAVEFVCFPD